MTREIVLTQGQSDITEAKERGLQAAFAINLRIFRSAFGGRFPYWHFDLNCGSGMNDEFGCIGSPLAFLRATKKESVGRYFAMFCDKHDGRLGDLLGHEEVAQDRQAFVFHGDNASLVDAIPDIIAGSKQDRPHMARGMVLADPNGPDVPLDGLADLSLRCPGLDIAVNWNCRFPRLRRGLGLAFTDIDEAIYKLNKAHWLIRLPMGNWSHTVLVGRNSVKVGDHKALGFFHLDSREGQEIFAKCRAGDPLPPRGRLADPQMELAF